MNDFQRDQENDDGEEREHRYLSVKQKLEILWDDYTYRKRRRKEKVDLLKTYGMWAAAATALASAFSTITGLWPLWKK